jgi:hypothetical protein
LLEPIDLLSRVATGSLTGRSWFELPAPNLEPGDVVLLADGREALVTARVETRPGRLAALLEVVVAPPRSLSAG